MNIFITGASGFLGSALCSSCALKAYTVMAASRSQTSSNLFSSCLSPEFSADSDWRSLLLKQDVIIHTAARVHMMNDGSCDPLAEYRRVNVEGTLNLAHQAVQSGVNRFIFISSIKVNGEETKLGLSFSASGKVSPIDPYGISKYEAEVGLQKISKETGMEVVIIRPPLVYGPKVKANFATLMRLIARGLPLPLGAIYGNRRSFVALDNLIDLIITCIEHPAAANQTFLVSDGEDLSTTDLLRRIAFAMGKPSRLIPIPSSILKAGASLLGKGEMAQRLLGSLQIDIEKTRCLLGWSPPISLDEGLRRAVDGV
jgi:UDP-glucose 4-epimerase